MDCSYRIQEEATHDQCFLNASPDYATHQGKPISANPALSHSYHINSNCGPNTFNDKSDSKLPIVSPYDGESLTLSFTGSATARGSCMSPNLRAREVLIDDLHFVELQPAQIDVKQLWRVSFVYYLIEWGSPHDCLVIPQCSSANDLWLRTIEGDDSGDDVWLWADGDEDWIRENASRPEWLELKDEQWAAARLALRRRLERMQRALHSVPNSTTNSTFPNRLRNERLRAATPAQRLAAVTWLIRTSKHREELDYRLGWSSRSNFSLGDLIWKWHADVLALLGSFPLFPEQPEAWREFKEGREAMGCECLDLSLLSKPVPDWFRMVVWLREEGDLDVDCLSPDQCQACEFRAHEVYKTFYCSDHFQKAQQVPMLLAFSLEAVSIILAYTRHDSAMLPFAQAAVSKSLRPASLPNVDKLLRNLYGPGERDLELPPWVNSYPSVARYHLQGYSCQVVLFSELPPAPPVDSQDDYLDALPVGFADEPRNLAVLVGTIAWILGSRFLGIPSRAPHWHDYWGQVLDENFMQGLSSPEPTGAALILRNDLKRLNAVAQGSCCGKSIKWEHYHWTTYSAVMMFVKSRITDPRFVGCPRCHEIYSEAMSASSVQSDSSRMPSSQDPGFPHALSLAAETVAREQHVVRHVADFNVCPTTSPVFPQRFSTQYIMTASVTQKYFKDIPDLSEYLRRLHNDPVASGGYGIVYKCSLRDGNDSSLVVAVKSFRYEIPLNSEPEPKFSKTLRREVKVWRELRHPNIVPLLGIAYGFGSAISTVSPWICGGPLHAYLDARDAGLNLSDRFGLLEGVAAGLDYLHSFPVVHGDLSSGNILIDDDGKARLSDFGLCTVVGGLSGGSSFGWATRRPGAIPWAAPELVLPPYTVQPCTASDIFSFGCIMLQILSGQIPWGKMNVCEIVLALSRGKRAPRLEHRPICQRDWDFIQRCWSSADVRPTVGDVVNFISPVLASLREDCSLIVDASLQSSESPASLKRTYNGVVLGHDSASVGTETPEVDDRTYLLKRPRL